MLDDDPSAVFVLERLLIREGYRVAGFTEPERFLAAIIETEPDAICLDLHVPGYEGMALLAEVRRLVPEVPVIMLTADDHPASVVAAMRAGAYDYATKPIDRERLGLTLRNAVTQRRLLVRLRSLEHPGSGRRIAGMFARSAPMLDLFRQLDAVTARDVPVLIQGEVGTGKARLARAIHARSSRRSQPFVEMNLATAPESVQAATLFGYSRNASPDGRATQRGLLDQAAAGTLLLRDVSELGPVAQAGLLRLLQQGTFLRVGGSAEVPCDVRVIAASSRDLGPALAEGRFSEALYYRLAVFDLRMPPLRDRPEDVVPLATEFLREFGADAGPNASPGLSPDAVDALVAYPWPGNVRELSNAMHRAVIAARGQTVTVDDLPSYVRPGEKEAVAARAARGRTEVPAETLESLERRAILGAMSRHGGNAAAASRELGIGRATLYRKLKAYGAATPGA